MKSIRLLVSFCIIVFFMIFTQGCSVSETRSGQRKNTMETGIQNFDDDKYNNQYLLFVKSISVRSHEGLYSEMKYLSDLYTKSSIEEYDVLIDSICNNKEIADKIHRISYDGRKVVTVENKFGYIIAFKIYDIESTDIFYSKDIRMDERVQEITFSPYLNYYLIKKSDGIYLYSIHDNNFLIKVCNSNIDTISFSPDEKEIVYQETDSNTQSHTLYIFNIDNKKIVFEKKSDMYLLYWHESGELLVMKRDGLYLTDRFEKFTKIYDEIFNNMKLSPDKRYLAYNKPVFYYIEDEKFDETDDFGWFVVDLETGKTTKMPLMEFSDQYPIQWIQIPNHYNPTKSIYNTCFYENCSMETKYTTDVIASSSLFNEEKTYEPKHVIDSDISTAWAEGKEDEGLNESIKIVTYKYRVGSLQRYEVEKKISGINIINGYSKSKDIYLSNNRVKKIKIEFSNGEIMEVDLEDNNLDMQSIKFSKPVETRYVKLTILSVYKGMHYNDTCISEIKLY